MGLPYQRHQKLKNQQQTRSSSSLSILKGKVFWLWDKEQHTQEYLKTNGKCCFNHIVGLPQKDKKEYPLFDYEKILYDSLLTNEGSFKDKHLWVKKATGLGVTEFTLRLMAWLCTSGEYEIPRSSQMCIVTGPNIEMATKLISIYPDKVICNLRDQEVPIERIQLE